MIRVKHNTWAVKHQKEQSEKGREYLRRRKVKLPPAWLEIVISLRPGEVFSCVLLRAKHWLL